MGAYYFDGWAGKNAQAGKAEWAKDAPTHLTKRLLDEFPDREPVWGWRDDKLETMERQIDLAADHGIAFFAICWHFIPEVTAGWDKRPWEGERGLSQKPGWYFPDRTPQTFGKFLQSSI